MNHPLLQFPFEPFQVISSKKTIKKDLLRTCSNETNSQSSTRFIEINIAILGGSTTDFVKDILELFLLDNGIKPTFYQSEYNKYYEDAIFGNEIIDSFHPHLIIIFTSFKNISQLPSVSNNNSDSILQFEITKIKQMWDSLSSKFNCPIIQNNYERPIYRFMGNMDIVDHRGHSNFVHRLNSLIYEEVKNRTNIFINDLDFLSADYGLSRWHDEQAWCMYKQAMSMEAVPAVAFSISNIVKSLYGKNKKALILDLDNTLWGGVIGDDGVNGIIIGDETSEGEAYSEFQRVIKTIRGMGILLNICSKNDPENAILGLQHPRSVLKPSDFTIIEANWDPKNHNVRSIIDSLNIGADSVVFVDDNPAEREIVEKSIPAVVAPKLGQSVVKYPYIITNSGFFEITSLTEDDLQRSNMYEENIKRVKSQQSFESYEDYLKSLEMIMEISSFNEIYLSRITQLINKTNQFNLTTKRVSKEYVETVSKSKDYIALYGRLKDKFGDNGLITVFVGKVINDELHIEIWLMSCRVLKRDVEYKLMEHVVKECKCRGIKKIYGYYYPTEKNRMVSDLYEKMGFSLKNKEDNGTAWEIDVHEYSRTIDYIREE